MKLIPLRAWLSHNVDKELLKHTPDPEPLNRSGIRLDPELTHIYLVRLNDHSCKLPNPSNVYPELNKLSSTTHTHAQPQNTQPQAHGRKRVHGYSQYSSIEEVVDRGVAMVLASGKDRPNHILALGYRRKAPQVSPLSFGDTLHMHGISCRFPNSVVSFLKRPCWENLHRQIGDELFLRLIVHEVMLLKLPVKAEGDTEADAQIDLLEAISKLQNDANEPENAKRKRKRKTPLFVQVSGTIMATLLSAQAKVTSKNKRLKNPRMSRPMIMYSSRYGNRCELPAQHILRSGSVKQVVTAIWNPGGEHCSKRAFKPSTEQRKIAKLLIDNYAKCPLGSLLNKHCPMRSSCGNVLRSSSSPEEVGAFVKAAMRRILPRAVGKERSLLKKIQAVVSQGRFESLSKNEIRTNLSIDADFAFWIFDNLLVSMLRSHFYCTEGSRCGNRIFYFRKPVWAKAVEKELKRLVSAKILEHLVIQVPKTNLAKLRFVPKPNGSLRPIMNLAYRGNGCRFSINQGLVNVYHCLKYEVDSRPELIGNGVHGLAEFYPKYLAFVTRMKKDLPGFGTVPLHIVTMDVKKCFDSIKHGKLFEILKAVIVRKEYIIHKHSMVTLTSKEKKVQRIRFVRRVKNDVVYSFLDKAIDHNKRSQTQSAKRNCIFSDGIESICMTKKSLFYALRKHIQSNHVLAQVGSKELLFRQISGIPQGSTVSTVLCNIYYGSIENQLINPSIERHEQGSPFFFIRLVDDFFYVSTSATATKSFVDQMHAGFPDFGMRVNASKTQISPSDRAEWIKWCGLKFHSAKLWVRMDHSRLHSLRGIYETFNADFSSRGVGEGLLKYLYNTVAQRGDPILFDATINSERNVVFNIAQLFVFVVLRIHYSVTKLSFVNHAFLADVFDKVCHYTFPLLQSRTSNRIVVSAKKLNSIAVSVGTIVFKRYAKLKPILKLSTVRTDIAYAAKFANTIREATQELFL